MRARAVIGALLALAARSPASALRTPSAQPRNEACTEYTLPAGSLLSGNGKLWEYFHFLIDFAPAVYYHIRNDTAPCKILYVPGWHDASKFSLAWEAHPQWSMEDKFDFFFAPLGLTIEKVATKEQMVADAVGRRLIGLSLHTAQGWANQSADYYTTFRRYAQGMPGVKAVEHDVLAVQRRHVQGYHGFKTASDRRRLNESFYAQLQGDMASRGWRTAVVSLEDAAMPEQISMFLGARVIVAQHGAALSNMIFARTGTLVVEIGHREHMCYQTLAQKLGLVYLHFEATSYPGGLSSIIRDAMSGAGLHL